jgi:DNA repair protein RadD
MTYVLRPYQQKAVDAVFDWLQSNTGAPLIVAPTGSGKSIIIAELVRRAIAMFGGRALVLVPSKELAEQNGEKLRCVLPDGLSIGYLSASLCTRQTETDVIVATIGTAYRAAGELKDIRFVAVDEAHLVSPRGADVGMYRRLISSISAGGRVVGLTATPFRGTGEWLTTGRDALFSGVASSISMNDLLAAGYLSPLVPPRTIKTRIETAGIATSRVSGDYVISQLAARVETYLEAVADEAITLAADRKKWIAFLPSVATAHALCGVLNAKGVSAAVVCGETQKEERAKTVAAFRAGGVRCLVTVVALATGFDVPDVDCILWARPTISPVLYVQGAGRGMRPVPGKGDCLWLDFTDTTERLGPINKIKGKSRETRSGDAPHKICGNCGNRCHTRVSACPACGAAFPKEEKRLGQRNASLADIIAQTDSRVYQVTRVEYSAHYKAGRPPSVRVDYFAARNKRVASEWVCPAHPGVAAQIAAQWWIRRAKSKPPATAAEALRRVGELIAPDAITVDESGEYPRIVGYFFADA